MRVTSTCEPAMTTMPSLRAKTSSSPADSGDGRSLRSEERADDVQVRQLDASVTAPEDDLESVLWVDADSCQIGQPDLDLVRADERRAERRARDVRDGLRDDQRGRPSQCTNVEEDSAEWGIDRHVAGQARIER